MLTTVYGRPALPIEQPGGELVGYLVEGVTPDDHARRRWVLTSPAGERHAVSEYPGRWHCTCRDFRYRRRITGCKHIRGLRDMIAQAEAGRGPDGDQGGAGTDPGRAVEAAGVRDPRGQ